LGGSGVIAYFSKAVERQDALTGAPIGASTRRHSKRVALFGAAATLATFALMATFSPIPAAHSAPASPQTMLQPDQLVGQPQLPPAPERPAVEDSNHVRASGRIGPDLTAALQRAGVPERVGREYVGVLGRAFPLRDALSVEDRFDLIYERGGEGRLLYVGIDRVARADLLLLKWTDGRETIWVNADPSAVEQTSEGMRMPVAGRVTSQFGSRFHPILGHKRMHKGVDLGAGSGAPIVAAADGRVVAAGWAGGYGRQVAIAHNGGIRTTYSHMSRISAQPGQAVRQGQVIGYVGSSGLSTGPHLHYEVYKNGRPVNPLSVKMTARPVIQGEKMHALRDKLRDLLTDSNG
jgi:murein DD-endopeptidase MepM/ murein hydrolase activator NlpD